MQYGIGTYISELTHSLLAIPDINIYVVIYKSNDHKEFSIRTESDRITEVNIPAPFFSSVHNNSFDNRYSNAVVRLLYDIVPKNRDVVFQINYIDDLPIAIKLKEYFTHPVISIVHFAQWQQIFDGKQEEADRAGYSSTGQTI